MERYTTQLGRYSLVPLVLMALASVGGSAEEGRTSAPNYFPLSPTLRVEMAVQYKIAGTDEKPASAVTYADGISKIGERRYYKVVTSITGTPADSTRVSYYRSDGRNIYQVFGDYESKGEFLFLPVEPKVGQKWTIDAPIGKMTTTVVEKEDVRIGETTYRDCLKIVVSLQRGFGTFDQTQWLAPGIGIIRQVQDSLLYSSHCVMQRFRN